MGIGDNRGVESVGVTVEVELLELEGNPMMGIEVVEPAAYIGTCGDRRQLEGRVAVHQPGAERTRIAGGAEHGDARSHGPVPAARMASAAAILRRRAATSSSVSVRSGARKRSRSASETLPAPIRSASR